MRKLILQLAVSLDNFIEGPNGEIDWCFTDQDYGMTEFLKRLDAMFIGRKSYELMQTMGDAAWPGFPKLTEYVFSNTLTTAKQDCILIGGDIVSEIKKIKSQAGKDIWLFGGASLISECMRANLVDEIILAVHPVLLGSGKPLFQNLQERIDLKLINSTTYHSGLVMLSYVPAVF